MELKNQLEQWCQQLTSDVESDTRDLAVIQERLRLNRGRLRHLRGLILVAKPDAPRLMEECARIMGVEPMHVRVLSQKLIDADIRPDLDRSPLALTARMHGSKKFKHVGRNTFAVV